MNTQRASNRRWRRGAAFLMLIVMVLLVVVGATQILVRGEIAARRSESDRVRARSMVTAIDAMRQLTDQSTDASESLHLPLNGAGSENIEVTINEEKSHITARWLRAGKVVDEMRQKLKNKVESSE